VSPMRHLSVWVVEFIKLLVGRRIHPLLTQCPICQQTVHLHVNRAGRRHVFAHARGLYEGCRLCKHYVGKIKCLGSGALMFANLETRPGNAHEFIRGISIRAPLFQAGVNHTGSSPMVRDPHPGIVLNQHYESDGTIIFREAYKLGCEGIVSKRLGRNLPPRKNCNFDRTCETTGGKRSHFVFGGFGQSVPDPRTGGCYCR
jgi:hypothetical protein